MDSINKICIDHPLSISKCDPHINTKLIIVLDLDETIIYARNLSLGILIRPGLRELLTLLKQDCFEVIVWTAAHKEHAIYVVDMLNSTFVWLPHFIIHAGAWMTDNINYEKNIEYLFNEHRTVDNILVIDDRMLNLKKYPNNILCVKPYHGYMVKDNTLSIVSKIINNILESSTTVPTYLLHVAPTLSEIQSSIETVFSDKQIYRFFVLHFDTCFCPSCEKKTITYKFSSEVEQNTTLHSDADSEESCEKTLYVCNSNSTMVETEE